MAGLGSAHTRDLWNSSLMQVEGVHSAAITEDPAKLLLEWGMLKHLWESDAKPAMRLGQAHTLF